MQYTFAKTTTRSTACPLSFAYIIFNSLSTIVKIYVGDMKRQLTTKHNKWNFGHNMQYNVKQNKKCRLLRSKRQVDCFLYANA